MFLFQENVLEDYYTVKVQVLPAHEDNTHSLSGNPNFEKINNRDNKLLSTNEVLLGNKQGETSRVSKHLRSRCYEFSHQLSLYKYYREISLATVFF